MPGVCPLRFLFLSLFHAWKNGGIARRIWPGVDVTYLLQRMRTELRTDRLNQYNIERSSTQVAQGVES